MLLAPPLLPLHGSIRRERCFSFQRKEKAEGKSTQQPPAFETERESESPLVGNVFHFVQPGSCIAYFCRIKQRYTVIKGSSLRPVWPSEVGRNGESFQLFKQLVLTELYARKGLRTPKEDLGKNNSTILVLTLRGSVGASSVALMHRSCCARAVPLLRQPKPVGAKEDQY